jgi:hypothetical protein
MKITNSILKQIIKEELNKLTQEQISEAKFAVYAGKRDAEKGLRPLKAKLFDTEEQAMAFKQQLSQQAPYTGQSFQAGKQWELTVAPYAKKEAAPAEPKGPTSWWVSQGNRWFGPYEDQTTASQSHDRGYVHEYPKGQKPEGA